jgi:hypothetical protein
LVISNPSCERYGETGDQQEEEKVGMESWTKHHLFPEGMQVEGTFVELILL